ncbi:MAG: DUF1648 domain-containing protein, partial [Bacteroidota bacterium]|nr:DUF1648 domain-containing protein [Bacteroidota bacterium]
MIPYAKGPSYIDKWLVVIAVGGLIACWLFPMFFYSELPVTIPIHFEVNGQPNNYSIRAGIWGIPIITTFIYVVLT